MKMLSFFYNYYLMLTFVMILIIMTPTNMMKFHPLTMSMLLTFYILISSMKLNFKNSMFWYSYILFLIMIGGLMILFMYFTSLANNQLFNMNMNLIKNFMMKLMFFFVTFYSLNLNYDLLSILFNNSLNTENVYKMKMLSNLNLNMIKNLMMDFLMDLNLYIIMYLFFTMICVMMMCNKDSSPLRQNFKY